MARFIARIDTTDLDSIVEYVASATSDWPEERREALCLDMLAALDDAIVVVPEKHAFVAEAGPALFDVLNRYSLNPVC